VSFIKIEMKADKPVTILNRRGLIVGGSAAALSSSAGSTCAVAAANSGAPG
jgi:hypothetical protein